MYKPSNTKHKIAIVRKMGANDLENNAICLYFYFKIRGGSLKKMAKKIIPSVPTNKKV